MHIVGTAGHVDHGKSSLVIALTGHNPDRLIEERERGMTLDLGFAPLQLSDGLEAGIIDVPGHERFLHNMLAGAAGMELLLLVIDATEGPRPQTFDHLRILDFLNVGRAIIVLTKRDLVDAESLAIAEALSREAVAGTVAQDAPVVAVSSLTGEGIAQLKTLIGEALAALPLRPQDAPAYLPVDRVFALPGHGTIVTGTLMQGTIKTGDTLMLQPSGLEVRARSIQTFGRKVESASGGARVAVNLPGIDVHAIRRGEALVAAREFVPVSELNVQFTPLPQALRLLKRRTPVRAHIGSDEIPGVLIFAGPPPADSTPLPARLVLTRQTVVYPGSRLIVRRMSPKDLLGGAVAGSPAARAQSAQRSLQEGDAVPSRALDAIEAAGLAPLASAQIAATLNVVLAKAQSDIDALVASGSVVALAKPLAYVSRAASDRAFDRVARWLEQRRRRASWVLGAATADIARELELAEPLAARLLAAWHDDGRLALTGRFWHLPDAAVELTSAQRDFFVHELREDPANPLFPVSFDALMERARAARIEGLTDAIETLLATGALVRIGDDVYRRAQIQRARALLAQLLKDGAGATMAQVRDAFGTSRRYALPLMEHFDGVGLTIRDGDIRRLRKVTPVKALG
ncbi:MAG TPA: selenocysteine-specific translation elongation factor [Magnetospirillaceae bacterium]|nr:selenocysteine-specific translation elongation factor [Magnetospirillaceae bacterium]